jgi:cytochrome c peroxidase
MFRLKALVISAFFAFFVLFSVSSRMQVSNASTAAIPEPPRDLMASDGDYISKVGLIWSAVRGATMYRIFRSATSDPSAAVEVGTTAAYYFFDTTSVQGQTYFYWVRAENTSGASGLSSSDQGNAAVGSVRQGGLQPMEPPPSSVNNPVTAAKAYLGKALFWDEQLSSTNTVSCGTCHRPATGGSDPRTIFGDLASRAPGTDLVLGTDDDTFGSRGVPTHGPDGLYSYSDVFGFGEQVTSRKSPSYLNGGFSPNGLFWDGRATNVFRDPISNSVILQGLGALESQASEPPLDAKEMAHAGANWPAVAQKISTAKPLMLAEDIPTSLSRWIDGRTYPQLFEEAFGTPEVTPARIALAIATHERVLFTDRTPLDRFLQSIENLPPQQNRGLQVFGQQQCGTCHGGMTLSNQQFENIGVVSQTDDPGRAGVTGNADHRAQFKVPSLRNVGLRGPYMHNGKFPTLESVVAFYNRGGDFDGPNIDHGVIRPLNLSPEQQTDLAAFLRTALTDPRVANELPPFDRPKLFTESTRVPVITGSGRAGTGGVTPTAVAIEPPFAGNENFTVAVSGARSGAQAVLVVSATDPGVGTVIPVSGSLTRQVTTASAQGAASLNITIPNDAATVGKTFYGRWYVNDSGAANGFAVSSIIRFTVFGDASARRNTSNDFDGDGKTDVAVFRPSVGEWWYLRSSDQGAYGAQFGNSTDIPATGDFTGDGKTDIAFFRPSNGFWYILRSEDGSFYAFPFGAQGDIPVPADYDGDKKADAAVYRPSSGHWYILGSSAGFSAAQFGSPGDIPQPGDYDGDGRGDFSLFRPNGGEGAEWWVYRSTAGVIGATFGSATDIPVAADYTGDTKTDMAFFRPETGFWYVLRSEDWSFYGAPFGISTDTPSPGDFDGDGKADFAVFRSSQGIWYINQSSGGLGISYFGIGGDVAPH